MKKKDVMQLLNLSIEKIKASPVFLGKKAILYQLENLVGLIENHKTDEDLHAWIAVQVDLIMNNAQRRLDDAAQTSDL